MKNKAWWSQQQQADSVTVFPEPEPYPYFEELRGLIGKRVLIPITRKHWGLIEGTVIRNKGMIVVDVYGGLPYYLLTDFRLQRLEIL